MNKGMLGSTLFVFLAACSQEVPVAPPPVATSASATAVDAEGCSSPSTTGNGAQQDSKMFSIRLIDKPVCSEGATAVATWDVSSLQAADVSIYIASPGNEKKLWLDGTATGTETTGKWVFENSCFTLQNKDTGRVLATRFISGIPCTR